MRAVSVVEHPARPVKRGSGGGPCAARDGRPRRAITGGAGALPSVEVSVEAKVTTLQRDLGGAGVAVRISAAVPLGLPSRTSRRGRPDQVSEARSREADHGRWIGLTRLRELGEIGVGERICAAKFGDPLYCP